MTVLNRRRYVLLNRRTLEDLLLIWGDDMEKTGEIKQGVTPPEQDNGEKQASEEELESHVTKRLADAAKEQQAARQPRSG